MNNDELKDLFRYFTLSRYRDGDYFLLDEYEELNEIVKRNSKAKELDDARYNYIKGKITEEEYNELYNRYFNLVIENSQKKTRKI